MSGNPNAGGMWIDQYRDPGRWEACMAIHARFSTNANGWSDWIFDALSSLPSDARILELGCGTAQLWVNIGKRIPDGWDITLSDLSAGMLDAAWRNLVVLGRNFKFEQMDARSIPYGDDTFDAVIVNTILDHVPDRDTALREIRRTLKSGGRLFAAAAGAGHMQEMLEWTGKAHQDRMIDGFSIPFSPENGIEELASIFREVLLKRYEDSLHVTEVEPILAYIRSMIAPSDLDEDRLVDLRTELEARLFDEKKILITKDLFLFEAVK